MKELTTEQIQIAAANYRLARQHMTNAVEELRKFVIAMTNVNDGKVTGFNPFDERRGGLNLNNLDDRDLADYRRRLEKGCWRLLLGNTGVMEAATRDDRCSLEEQINNGAFGAFTEESIIHVLQKLKETEGSFVKNVAREAFRYFSPNYAKKEPIRQRTVYSCAAYGSISFSSCYTPAWELLEKALLLLDRKPLPDYSDSLVCRMNEAVQRHQQEFECPYFRAKFYEKSKTAHLTFTRMDLIDAINEIGRAA